jgi:hypothetical protein
MKTVKIILITATILSYVGSSAQSGKKVADKTFKTLLDRYITVNPPINYKRIEIDGKDMTKEEAIRFFHKTENDLIWTIRNGRK